MARVPALRIEPPSAERPPPDHLPLERWEGAPGGQADAVLGWRLDGRLHFHFPGLAHYVCEPAFDLCTASACAGASDAQLADTYRRAVLPLLLQAQGTQVLHASAVDTPQGVVALAARSGTGKSTLAAAWAARGQPLWADDAVVWSVSGGQARSSFLPFALRLKGDAAVRAPEAAHPAGTTRPLRALVVLRRAEAQQPALRRLDSPAQRLTAILPHAYCFSTREPEARRRLAADYLALLAAVPLYELSFRPSLAQLPALAECLDDGLAHGACLAA